jgi:hypothetical protein
MEWHWLALLVAAGYFTVVLVVTLGFLLLESRAEQAPADDRAPAPAGPSAAGHKTCRSVRASRRARASLADRTAEPHPVASPVSSGSATG